MVLLKFFMVWELRFEQKGAEEHVAIYMNLALYLNPKLDQAYLKLGKLYESLAQHETAIRYFESIQKESLLFRSAQRSIGLNYNSLKNLDEARNILTNLIETDPLDIDTCNRTWKCVPCKQTIC